MNELRTAYSDFLREKYDLSEIGVVDYEEMLITSGTITEMEALNMAAGFFDTTVVNLERSPCEMNSLDNMSLDFCIANAAVPWKKIDGSIVYATWSSMHVSSMEHFVFATKNQVLNVIKKHYCRHIKERIASNKIYVQGYNISASNFSSKHALIMLMAFIVYIATFPAPNICIMLGIASITSMLFKLHNNWFAITRHQYLTSSYCTNNLPIYTILLPLYKENRAIICQLINSISMQKYPLWRMDIKVIVEEDDNDVIDILSTIQLPRVFEIVVVPASFPRTKAKASNYALLFARGEYLTIFDAEDVPDDDQLNKAVSLFTTYKDVNCLQARLEIYNEKKNLLTRLFALEYKLWHRIGIRGMCCAGLPTPLCGSSTHFRTQFLRYMGAWDAYNVTEDAELGMRIYANQYKVHLLDSRTLEEAPATLIVWIRQRIRWIKGFVTTHAIYASKIRMLVRTIGYRGYFGLVSLLFLMQFMSQIAGFVALVLSPFLRTGYMFTVCYMLIFSSMAVQAIQLISLRERGATFMLPLYMLYVYTLHMIAVIGACIKLLYDPLGWEKTPHTETMDRDG